MATVDEKIVQRIKASNYSIFIGINVSLKFHVIIVVAVYSRN